jgi:uncharacterized SAM-binding protein YcdF (DUF218 family)
MFVFAKVIGFLLNPFNLLIWGLLGSVYCIYHERYSYAKKGLFVALLYLTFLGYVPLANWSLRQWENRSDQWIEAIDFNKVYGLVVLGGSFGNSLTPEERKEIPLNESAERVTKALELAKRYPHLKIIFSGASADIFPKGWSEAEMAKRFFVEQGIDASRLILDNKARNTQENVKEIKSVFLSQTNSEKTNWVLITSASHMPRAYQVFKKQGIEVKVLPVDYQTDLSGSWLGFDVVEGYHQWNILVHEILGSVWYKVNGWI